MNRSAALKLVLACTALGVAATGHAAPSPAELRAELVRFAVSKSGQRLGRGECTDLVTAALAEAGAKPLAVVTTSPALVRRGYPAQTYDWGRRFVITGKPVNPYSPGMILQFENCEFKKPDGTASWSFPHHTAIVKSARGTVVTLLHQNAPVGGPVVELTLDTAWLQRVADPAPGKAVVLHVYSPRGALADSWS